MSAWLSEDLILNFGEDYCLYKGMTSKSLGRSRLDSALVDQVVVKKSAAL